MQEGLYIYKLRVYKKPRLPCINRKRGFTSWNHSLTSTTPLSSYEDGSFATHGYPCCALFIVIRMYLSWLLLISDNFWAIKHF